MKRRLLPSLLVAGLTWVLSPQPAHAAEHSAQGYIFVAPGAFTGGGDSRASIHLGAGGEGFIHNNLALGGELGYAAPWRDLNSGLGVLSLDGSYHFLRSEKLSPFFTTGYSLGFRSGHTNFFNYGIGANYWFRERQGIRLEFRDHVNDSGHIIEFRFAFAFR